MNFNVDGTAPSSGENVLGVFNPNKRVLAKVKPGSIWLDNKGFSFINNGYKDVFYKDFNGDGFITDDEIYKIQKQTQNDDGTIQVNRMIDNDGDGYADQRVTCIYDENGELLEEVSESIDPTTSDQNYVRAEDMKMSNILSGLHTK